MPTRILLVEDNLGDAVIFREKLDASDLDYELVHAKRLADGLEQLHSGHFDIMMVDLSLPDAHGMEAVIKVREAAPTHPLIVLTGLDDARAAAEAKHRGAVDYLVKWYVDSDSLARYIRYAIAHHKMMDRETPDAERPAEVAAGGRGGEAEGIVAPPNARPPSDETPHGEAGAEALRTALEASTSALLIVDADGDIVFANPAARAWVQSETYPWTLAEGVNRIPRKGQALEQHASRTTWQDEAAWVVSLRAARPSPEQTVAPAAESPSPDPLAQSSTAARAAEAALAFIERAQQQSAWLADVLRSALDADRDIEVQADLIDVLDLTNQVVREQRDLAMQRGLPIRVSSERKKVMAYADRNLVNRLLQRLIVDAVHEARHDGVHLRADVEGDTSVVEARWHSAAAEEGEDTHATLGRSLVEHFARRTGGTCAHDVDGTGRHTFSVRLPGQPGA